MNWTQFFRHRPKISSQPVSESQSPGIRLLVITEDDFFYGRLERISAECNWTVCRAHTIEQGRQLLHSTSTPLVIYDWEPAGNDWREGVMSLTASPGQMCIFLASRVLDDNLWQELMRFGGYDVLLRSAEREEIKRDIAFAWFWMGRPKAQLDAKKETPHF